MSLGRRLLTWLFVFSDLAEGNTMSGSWTLEMLASLLDSGFPAVPATVSNSVRVHSRS